VTARWWITLGAFNGFLAVAFGAFAAHGLRGRIAENLLLVFEKGVDYQGFHAIALICVGLLLLHRPDSRALRWSGAAFLTGVLLFSGSLYALAITGARAWGMVTPFGGVGFLLGWILLGVGGARR
jgi:uncharacterized membrane protein YgdD (TMEM256/DUF423 family)